MNDWTTDRIVKIIVFLGIIGGTVLVMWLA